MGKGRRSPSSIPRRCLPSQRWGNTGLALPGLAPGLLAHLRRSQTDPLREQVPALLHVCQHRSADCRSHRAENVCGFWREGLQAVLSNSLPRHLGRRGPNPAASAAAGLDPQPPPGTVPLAWRLLGFGLGVVGSPRSPRPCCSGAEMGASPEHRVPFCCCPARPAGAFGVISVPFCPCPNF